MKHLLVLTFILFSFGMSAQLNPKHIYLNGKQDTATVLTINSMGAATPNVVVFPASYDSLRFVGLGNGEWAFSYLPGAGFKGDADLTIQYYEPTGIPGLFLPNYTSLHYRIKDSEIIAEEDFVLADGSSTTEIDVLTNDSSSDGPFVLERIAFIEGGTASISNNKIQFASDGSSNLAYIRYFIKDQQGTIESSGLYIAIEDDNIQELRKLSLDKLSSIELHLNSLNYSPTQMPSNGTLTQDGHLWTYNPDDSFTGTESIIFESAGGGEIEYEISVVNKLDDRSFVRDDQYFIITDGSLNFNVFDNDYHDTYNIIDYSTDLTYLGGGQFEYSPPSGFVGDKVFFYKIYAGYQFHVGNIYIHIDNFAPRQDYSYDFTILNNHDLLIDHEAPVSEYYFQTLAAPSNGTLIILDENETETLECEFIEGNNTLLYIPDTDFNGIDQFTVEFCTDTGICENVSISVNVLSSNYDECLCLVDCVYEGDNNNDGVVNLKDALDLAINFGEGGQSRSNDFDLFWTGQESTDWGYSQRGNNSDLKAGDADGNGFIEYEDFNAFEDNYGLVHNFVPNNVGTISSVPISFVPQSTELDSGDWLFIDIYAGSSSVPALDIYGLSFSFNINPDIMDSSSVSFALNPDNFLQVNSPLYEFIKVPIDGRVDIALSRLTRQSADGVGLIATLGFIVEDEVEGLKDILFNGYREQELKMSNIISVDEFGSFRRHPNQVRKVNIATEADEDERIANYADLIRIYPNPASERITIISERDNIDRIELFDTVGKLLNTYQLDSDYFNENLEWLEEGTYFIRIHAKDQSTTKKLIKLDNY